MSRLLIVSNRLPVTVRARRGRRRGGRAAAPAGSPPGCAAPHETARRALDRLARAELATSPAGARRRRGPSARGAAARPGAALRATRSTRYYEGYSNGVLWPLFHYCLASLPARGPRLRRLRGGERALRRRGRGALRSPATSIWVHDYQLMLVPGLLRERLPEARIGFFLHIPFPSSEIFRIAAAARARPRGPARRRPRRLPHAAVRAPLRVGRCCASLGVATEVDRVRWHGREVRLGVFPMGVDAGAPRRGGRARRRWRRSPRRRRGARAMRLLVGVDRLDYTKGIPRRLLAYEPLLRAHPELRERVRLVQVAVPSRENVDAYRELREQVDELVGRINGELRHAELVARCTTCTAASARAELVALYRAADVDAGHAAARRHEPRGEGVRRLARGRGRRPRPERVRRRRAGAGRGAPREPVRRRAHRRRRCTARSRCPRKSGAPGWPLLRRGSSPATCTAGRGRSWHALERAGRTRRGARRRVGAGRAPRRGGAGGGSGPARAAPRLRRHARAVRADAGPRGARRRAARPAAAALARCTPRRCTS